MNFSFTVWLNRHNRSANFPTLERYHGTKVCASVGDALLNN
uniref:Uncharacterized protein n=1 Tax=Arundo donax TaxID=35708 RepID=A0A0A9GYW4_ARUDO